jgi:hypothetical protein
MQDLIERLEKATGPDREIDHEIDALVGEAEDFPANEPRYTASIDAALTLVPEGLTVDMRRCDDGATAYATVRASDMTPDDPGDELFVEASMPTLAIALCIAALKARTAVSVTPA